MLLRHSSKPSNVAKQYSARWLVPKLGGILSVTAVLFDPDYRRPATIRREVEAGGFRLVESFGGFPTYTQGDYPLRAGTRAVKKQRYLVSVLHGTTLVILVSRS